MPRKASPPFAPVRRAGRRGRSSNTSVIFLVWALWLARGERGLREDVDRSWADHVGRFFDGLRRLDEYLASDAALATPPEKLFQGPIADALWHVGQLATLRRLAGSPIRGENYFVAEITVGRVGPDQSSKRREFD